MAECDCDEYVGMGEHFCGRPNEGEENARIKELEAELLKYRTMAARYIESDEWREKLRRMRSRVEMAKAPFGKGLELRLIVTAFDLVETRNPYAVIEYVIDKARLDLRREAERLGLAAAGGTDALSNERQGEVNGSR